MTTSGIKTETIIRCYCAGPPHNHHAIHIDGLITEHDVEFAIRMAGFRQSPDGRWWCEKHRPMRP